MHKYLLDFKENIEGLREFVELINPFLKEHSKKVMEEHKDGLLPLAAAFMLTENDEQRFPNTEKLIAAVKEKFDITYTIEEIEREEKKGKTVSFKFGDKQIPEFETAMKNFTQSEQQKQRLFISSLISLLSAIEWFYSQVLHFYYDKYPNSSGIKKKSLTLEEIKNFNSLKDAETYLIDEKIEQILRSSFNDWISVMKDELDLKMSYLEDYEDSLTETFQRRNILVHNGGIVNSIYLSKVKETQRQGLQLGIQVGVREEYLERTIDEFHLAFSLIACELWKKISPEDEQRSVFLMDLGYFYLRKRQYGISATASIFLINDKKMPIARRTAAQLNFWLAKKRTGKEAEVQKEFNSADYSDKALIFQVALASLRGEKEMFFKNIIQVIKTEEISVQDLFEFPIFEEMRETHEFKDLIDKEQLLKDYLSQKTAANKSIYTSRADTAQHQQ